MNNEPQMLRRRPAIDLLVIGTLAARSLTSGGSSGTEDSPSASFNRQRTTGQTTAD